VRGVRVIIVFLAWHDGRLYWATRRCCAKLFGWFRFLEEDYSLFRAELAERNVSQMSPQCRTNLGRAL
jgi:hypothetical protein